MVTGFLDTAVVVDLLRSYSPAEFWLSRQGRLAVTPLVWVEIIEGARDAASQKRAVALLRHFERVDLLSDDFDWAIQQALQLRLRHGVGMMDCLIASVAYRLEKPLYTRNVKHFAPMLGALAQKPY